MGLLLLESYDEALDSSLDRNCGNCSGCQPDHVCLSQLPEIQHERNELPGVVDFVRSKLSALAIDLDTGITSALHLACIRNVRRTCLHGR